MGRHSDRKRSSRSRSPANGSRSARRRSKSPRDREDRGDRGEKDRDRDRGHRSRKHRSRSPKSRSPTSDRRRDRGGEGGSSKYRSRSRSPDSKHRSRKDRGDREDRKRGDRSNGGGGHNGSRSRSPSYHRSSKRSHSPDRINRERVEDVIGRNVNYKNFDIDEQQKHLEKLMQERRERVEKWRQAQKQTEGVATTAVGAAGASSADAAAAVGDAADSAQKSSEVGGEGGGGGDPSTGNQTGEGDGAGAAASTAAGPQNGESGASSQGQKKKWTLDDDEMMTGEYDDDDDEDDEENGGVPMDDDEDEDSATLNLPQRRIDDDAGGDEDKIEKVVSNDAQKPSSQLQKAAAAAAAAEQAAATRAAPEQQQQQLQTPAAAATTTVAPETTVPTKEEEAEEEDDIDPLDAFMAGIQEEVKKYRTQTLSKADPEKGHHKVTVVVGVAKKKTAERSRGELIEQNQDAMEYSSSDEVEKGDELANAMDTLQAKAKQKKPLTISLDDISYIPFRKNFYIEVPEIGRMTAEEVEAYKTEMEGIKTKGKGCPRPIKNWAQCGVSKKVMDILKKNNFEKPTPIQCQAIPAIMSGRDLIGIAKTGSGKTLAFLIPMFRHILDQPRLEPGDGPIAIIMTPTRELATQIYGQCRKFTKYLSHLGRGDRGDAGSSSRDSKENRLRVVAVYGGTPISEQIGDLKPGAEIVVCTPGRMIDMLAANSGRVTNLRRCTYVVLDEADRMFDMGFEPQVMRIIDGIRPDRQTVMFSATFPRIMEALARRILDKPIEVQVGGRSVVAKEVEQNVVIIKEDDKFLKLLEVLGKYATAGSAIVFVDKQEHADMLLKELMHASYTVLALHGGIDQNDRDSTISDFKNGKVNVLVATSVAARGLDVKHTIVVVNYDCPNHYEDYVHRCGRTGRAGNKGHAYTFITPEQGRYAQDLIKAHEQSGIPVPAELQKLFDDYKVEQEAMGKKVKSSSGFSGKGFKFDEAEAQQAIEKKRIQKAALGLNDSDDEEVEKTDADIDQEIENMLAPKKKAEKGTAATAAATAAAAVAAAAATAAALSASGSSSSAAAGPSTPTITPSASVAAAVAAAAAAAASINASLAAASSASGVGASISTAPPASSAQPERSIAEKMELAKQMASKIALSIPNLPSSASLSASAASSSSTGSSLTSNYPSATAHTEAILKGDTYSLGDITSAVTAKSIAEQRAERLHAKLNYIPRDSDYNDSGELVGRRGLGVGGCGGGLLDSMDVDMGAGPDGLGGGGGSMGGLAGGSGLGGSSSSNVSQRIEQELEINDFPQQARWRVTSKEAIAQISEFSEAGITVRGTYYPQGKEPPAGERKLYLAIEATNEKAVSLARAEIVRLIKEELHKMSNSNLPARGNRYKVL